MAIMARVKNNVIVENKANSTVQVNLSAVQNKLLKKLLAEPIDAAEEAAIALCIAKDFLAGYKAPHIPEIEEPAINTMDEAVHSAILYYP